MKKLFSVVLIFSLLFATPVLAAPTVELNGKPLAFEPTIENGRTLVPLRAIFEAVGATVDWDQDTQTATANKGSTKVLLSISSNIAEINGQPKILDVPAKIVNGRILAPLRFVGEAFGGIVEWSPEAELISITFLQDQVHVHFIDVGQADSIYISLPDNNDILIDAGGKKAGPKVVEYLKKQNVDDIELMIATHPHEDHIGGIPAVLEAYQVKTIIDSGHLTNTATSRNYSKAVASEGAVHNQADYQSFYFGDIEFKVLTGNNKWSNVNDYSVVTLLDIGNIRFLFMGDAEKAVEDKLYDVSAEILKVGHHGSSTSTSPDFLDRVTPNVAVISVGEGNSYGHPSPSVIKRLEDSNISIYRTDIHGDIVVSTDGCSYDISCHTAE